MNFCKMMEISKTIDDRAVELRDKLLEDITDLPLNGEYINDGKSGGAVIAVVKFSELQKTHNWSPDFHLPPQQSRAISKGLGDLKTATGIVHRMEDILTNGYVSTGGDKHLSSDRVYLNPRTYKAVLESELGQYVSERLKADLLYFLADYCILNLFEIEKLPEIHIFR